MSKGQIIILLTNIVLAIYLAGKISTMKKVNLQNKQILDKIEKVVSENTQIVNIIIEELETKIAKASEVINQSESIVVNTNKATSGDLLPPNEKQIQNGSKILYLKKQGLSIEEIAEKLNIPQGEIKLKINLHEKMNSVQNRNY